MKELNSRQEEVLYYIFGYEVDTGIVPSLYQIGENFGFTKQNAALIVTQLINMKRLKKVPKFRETRSYMIK